MSNIAIQVEGLTKLYKLYKSPIDRLKEALHPFRKQLHQDFYALNNICFEIKQGDSVGIIGRNGSGKSTLLKILTGILTPTSGKVTVNGKISALLELGAGFNPELTGLENVYFNGMLMGYTRPEIDERLDSILSFADIGQFIYQPVKTYSSGMFVRLAFAVAVNVEPEILIVDEALAVGDLMFQGKCMDKINSMTGRGVTTLFVTHDMNSVNTICNHAIMLDSGEIYSQGKSQVITLKYFELIREKEHANQISTTKKEADELYMSKKESIRNKADSENYSYGTGAATITEFKLINSENIETSVIGCGEKFTIQISAQFKEYVDNPCVGFAINNVAGQYLLSANSFFDKIEKIGSHDVGDILIVNITTVMLLNPGEYLLSLGLADHRTKEDYTNLDARRNICKVTVCGKGTSSGMVYHEPEFTILKAK